jgi:hypothetical protein
MSPEEPAAPAAHASSTDRNKAVGRAWNDEATISAWLDATFQQTTS